MNILKFPNKFKNSMEKHEFELNNKLNYAKPAINETIVKARRNHMITSARRKRR